MIGSGSFASISSAATAGWRPTPTWARNIGRSCRALAWQRRATEIAIEQERPVYVLEALGPVPASTRGQRAWRQAAAEIEQYRRSYQVTDPERALGPEPHDPAQRADRQRARSSIERPCQAAGRRPHP